MDRPATDLVIALDDEPAFVASIEPLLPAAFRLAYGLLRDEGEAEDAVQEAGLAAWRRRRTFRTGAEPGPWFLAIVANECRRIRRRPRWFLAERPEAAAAPADAVTDEAARLRAALGRLGHDDRLAIVLRYYMDLPHEEVGRILGVSEATARVRVHRALGRLRPVFAIEEDPAHG